MTDHRGQESGGNVGHAVAAVVPRRGQSLADPCVRDRSLRAVAVVALGLGLAAAALPGGARAQVFGGWSGWDNGGTWDGLAPQQVRRAITERGFRMVSPLRRNGSVFVADVLDQRGQHERLIVAAADAQILQRFLIDDGRGTVPRDQGRGFAAPGPEDGLVPPADIPEGGRRVAHPLDHAIPVERFGDLGAGNDGTDPAVDPDAALRRGQPPIRTVKPRPRVVERMPEAPAGERDTGGVEATPLVPLAARPTMTPPPPPVAKAVPPVAKAPPPVAKAVPPAPAVVASRPAPAAPPSAAPAPVAPAAPVTTARRMTDPLAIPGAGDGPAKPVRAVGAGITGAPAPAAKSGDVPVAPLD